MVLLEVREECLPRWSGVFPMLSLSFTDAPYDISN